MSGTSTIVCTGCNKIFKSEKGLKQHHQASKKCQAKQTVLKSGNSQAVDNSDTESIANDHENSVGSAENERSHMFKGGGDTDFGPLEDDSFPLVSKVLSMDPMKMICMLVRNHVCHKNKYLFMRYQIKWESTDYYKRQKMGTVF